MPGAEPPAPTAQTATPATPAASAPNSKPLAPAAANGSSAASKAHAAGRAANELDTAVDELLETMQARFRSVSDDIIVRMDDMTKRIDALEASLRDGSDKA